MLHVCKETSCTKWLLKTKFIEIGEKVSNKGLYFYQILRNKKIVIISNELVSFFKLKEKTACQRNYSK